MNGNDMVFSYIKKDSTHFVKTKICSDPVKTENDVLVIYNSLNYSNEEVIEWIEKVKSLFGLEFTYNILDNTYENYVNIIDLHFEEYLEYSDTETLKSNYNSLSKNKNEGYLLYFYFPKEINFRIKYLLFVILRYGICETFKELRKMIEYLNKERKLDLWKSIYFSHFDDVFDKNLSIVNNNNFVVYDNFFYFTFIKKTNKNVFFDLKDVLNNKYLESLDIYNLVDETKIGSAMFSFTEDRDHYETVSFKELNDEELAKFIESYTYESRMVSYLNSKSFDYLKKLKKINDELIKDKFNVIKNDSLYKSVLDRTFKFLISNNPLYYSKDLKFYYDNFADENNERNIDKSIKFLKKYNNQLESLSCFQTYKTYSTTIYYIKHLIIFENYNQIYNDIIKNVYENKRKTTNSRSRSRSVFEEK